MNRSWITALTLATVVGTGGAFVAVITAPNDQPVAASPEPAEASLVTPVDVTSPRLEAQGTVAYRLDAVGIVTVQVAEGKLTVVSSVADPGWKTTGSTATGTHAEAQFTDGAQLVTFTADLSVSNVMVAVSNVSVATPVDATPATTAPVPTDPPDTLPATRPTATHPAPATTVGDDRGGDDGDRGMEPNDD